MIAKVYIFTILLVGAYSRDLYRARRDISSIIMNNPDGSRDVHLKIPMASNDEVKLSALGNIGGAIGGKYSNAGGGFTLENVKSGPNDADSHISLTGEHIPTFGDTLTAAGKLNLVHNDKHNLDLNAFFTRNQPKFPNAPDFNTKGGSLDYTFNNKLGASVGVTNTDYLHKNDYSVMGHWNMFHSPTTSVDLSAGLKKSVSPFLPRSSWAPIANIVFHHYW